MNSQTVRCPEFLFSLPEGDFCWDHHYNVPAELKAKCEIECIPAPYAFVAGLLNEKVAPLRCPTNKCVYLISKDAGEGIALLACCYDSRAWLFSLSY